MSEIKNPIAKLIQKEISDYNENSFSGDKKLTACEIKDRTENHIMEVLKMCQELGPFYKILKGLLCGVYELSDEERKYWPDSVKELFLLYEEKLSFVVYESVPLVYRAPPDEDE